MSERIVVVDRLSSSPRERGSASGQTCPDFLALQGDTVGVIGELPDVSEQNLDEARLVVPADLVYDTFAKMFQP